MRRLASWTLCVVWMLPSGQVRAGDVAAPPLPAVSEAWSRATAPGASVGVAYFDIRNEGPADVLLGIESSAAGHVEMHETTMTPDGMMRMRQTKAVTVPAAGHVVFGPSGLHAMLVGLKHPLQEGTRLPLTLLFRRAGKIEVLAQVLALGAQGPPPAEFRLTAWPRHTRTPDFALVDVDGRARRLADYRGQVVVLFFGFVHCPDVCPAELFKLSLVMKKLGPASDRVRVLFVTLDPARDTRKVLKGYVDAFDPRFVGLTGTSAQIDAAARNFFVEYARVGAGADYTIDHSTSTFVLDRVGKLRLLGTMTTGIDDYAHDLATLTAE